MPLTALTNTAALSAQTNIQKNTDAAGRAMGRISSGSRIVKASDDTASAAITNKLDSLVAGLDQAAANASQASSLLQVATGGLTNLVGLLTRMRALGTQVNNSSLGLDERGFANIEFQQLKLEFDDIVDQTRWNGNALLKGSNSTMTASGAVTAAITGFGTSIVVPNTFDTTTPLVSTAGLVSGTFESVNVTANASSGYDVTVVINTGKYGKQTLTATGASPSAAGTLALADSTGNTLNLKYAAAVTGITSAATFEAALSQLLGTYSGATAATVVSTSVALDATNGIATVTATQPIASGKYAVIYDHTNDLLHLDDGRGTRLTVTGATNTNSATYTFSNGVAVTLGSAFTDASYTLTFNATSGQNSMSFQVADKSSDVIAVGISGVTTAHLGIDQLKVDTVANAATALDKVAVALNLVNEVYATLGAQQKRLEIAEGNVKTQIENQVAARSTFYDAKLDREIHEFTKSNVLAQAAQAMLAQANNQQNSILSVLRS